MNEQAQHRRTTVRAGQSLTQHTARQDVRLRISDDEKRQSRDGADDELLLLLIAVAAAAAVFKQSHFNIRREKLFPSGGTHRVGVRVGHVFDDR